MNAVEQSLHFENVVRQEWTSPTTINAWQDWSEEQSIHCKPLTDALIRHAQLAEGQTVLDLAGGVGEPALPIARIVGATGSVVATDLSEGMLAVAADKARREGLTNLRFEVADVHELPYADNSFDRVVSRLGLMYFWNIEQAISEIHRVLKPGGVASFVVWGSPEQNEYFGSILAPFNQRREMPAQSDDMPTPTRFGDVSKLTALFARQGFIDVASQAYCEALPWPGTPRELFQHFYDMAVPLQPYIDSFDDNEREAVLQEIEEAFSKRWDGKYTNAFASFNTVYLTK